MHTRRKAHSKNTGGSSIKKKGAPMVRFGDEFVNIMKTVNSEEKPNKSSSFNKEQKSNDSPKVKTAPKEKRLPEAKKQKPPGMEAKFKSVDITDIKGNLVNSRKKLLANPKKDSTTPNAAKDSSSTKKDSSNPKKGASNKLKTKSISNMIGAKKSMARKFIEKKSIKQEQGIVGKKETKYCKHISHL